jgi:dihydrofolate reductase
MAKPNQTSAKLIYSAICSLDGYVADEQGNFDWAAPGEELHAFINELERPIGTYLYGRRMYETMVYWEDPENSAGDAVTKDYGEIWRAAEKIVYSRTLDEVSSARTRLEREFDPEAVSRLKAESQGDISVGGPALGAEAMRAGLVDELHLFLHPIVVGAGNPALPSGVRVELELIGERRFDNGVVHLHHRTRG